MDVSSWQRMEASVTWTVAFLENGGLAECEISGEMKKSVEAYGF